MKSNTQRFCGNAPPSFLAPATREENCALELSKPSQLEPPQAAQQSFQSGPR